MTRTSKADVIAAAGELFAAHGYEGTSMRGLGAELGLLGSSLYAHVGSKQDLLVEVVEHGARLFEASVADAPTDGSGAEELRALIAGHIDVVLDHRPQARTFLSEARSLDHDHRARVLEARDRYEQAFRVAFARAGADGSLGTEVDPTIGAILLLSVLNAVDRWFSDDGALDRDELVEQIAEFAGLV